MFRYIFDIATSTNLFSLYSLYLLVELAPKLSESESQVTTSNVLPGHVTLGRRCVHTSPPLSALFYYFSFSLLLFLLAVIYGLTLLHPIIQIW